MKTSTFRLTRVRGLKSGWYGSGGKGEKELDEVAKEHPATSSFLVETLKKQEPPSSPGFPVAGCSGVWFSKTQDSDGFCMASRFMVSRCALSRVRYGERPGLLCRTAGGRIGQMGKEVASRHYLRGFLLGG